MSAVRRSDEDPKARRWSEHLSWLRVLLQAVQTIAILVRLSQTL